MDAARALPVAAPPMIAPVAAPHAAPWPTGVSHELRVQETKGQSHAAKTDVLMSFVSRLDRTGSLILHASAYNPLLFELAEFFRGK